MADDYCQHLLKMEIHEKQGMNFSKKQQEEAVKEEYSSSEVKIFCVERKIMKT